MNKAFSVFIRDWVAIATAPLWLAGFFWLVVKGRPVMTYEEVCIALSAYTFALCGAFLSDMKYPDWNGSNIAKFFWSAVESLRYLIPFICGVILAALYDQDGRGESAPFHEAHPGGLLAVSIVIAVWTLAGSVIVVANSAARRTLSEGG